MQLGTRTKAGTKAGKNINEDDLRRTKVSKGGNCLRGLACGGGGVPLSAQGGPGVGTPRP